MPDVFAARPLTIADRTLSSPLVLAPLAGYTDLPFRLLCRELGAGLCYSEMISCHGVVLRQKNTLALLRTTPAERPVSFQLFGADPDLMGEAAAIVSEGPIDFLDINMGCPVKKVTKKGAGSALLKEPDRARAIIASVVRRSQVPVTVKIRAGWDRDTIVAAEFARMAEDAGARAVTVHARTWAQGFSGSADWRLIAMVREAVTIPVIGNGDVLSYRDALAMLEATGCAGVMIGRGAVGNPWAFQPAGAPPALAQRLAVLGRHLALIARFLDPDRYLARAKGHAGKYFRAVPGGAAIRRRIYSCTGFSQLEALVDTLRHEAE